MPYNELMLKYFSVIHRRAMMHLDRELKHYNINAGQVPILRILDEEDGISQDRITQALHMDKGALARTIRPLIEGGYIVREKTLADKRVYSITLTNKGREIMPLLSGIIADWINAITLGLSAPQKKKAADLLSKMSENAFTFFEDIKKGGQSQNE